MTKPPTGYLPVWHLAGARLVRRPARNGLVPGG
jgi:hypothetical protein